MSSTESKVDLIKQGKKKKNVTDFTEKKNVTTTNKGEKVLAVEKEKKVEEAGVTRKKKNFVMYESKIATETETEKKTISAPKPKLEPRPRVEEKIIQKRKKVEYLDNFQYKETKYLKKERKKPSVVIHQRLGDIIGGSFEISSYEKQVITSSGGKGGIEETMTKKQRAGSVDKTLATTETKTVTKEMKQNKSSTNIKEPVESVSATKTTTTKRTVRVVGQPTEAKGETTTEVKKVKRTIMKKGGETTSTTTTTTEKGKK